MASKRLLKKRLHRIVEDLLDECDYLIVHDSPNAEAADKLIDEAVEFYESVLHEMGKAKNKGDFRKIIESISAKEDEFFDRLNQLNK
jgi:hypothetical protein